MLDLMEDGEKSSSQATVVDGYDFDMEDYTDYHCLSLFVSHKSAAVYKSSRLPVARMITLFQVVHFNKNFMLLTITKMLI